jgi:hypothetical protein
MAPKQKSITFFMVMLVAFFALVKPVSTRAKPACIMNTRIAPMKSQITSRENPRLSILSWAERETPPAHRSSTAKTNNFFRTFLILLTMIIKMNKMIMRLVQNRPDFGIRQHPYNLYSKIHAKIMMKSKTGRNTQFYR